MSELNDKERQKIFNKRISILKACFALFGAILVIYLFAVQIIDIKNYRNKAKMQRSSKKFVMRGSILDRNGVKLASDQLSYNVYVHRRYLDHEPQDLAKRLAPYLKISEAEIVALLRKPTGIILIKKDIDRQTAEAIRKLRLREVSLDKKNSRVYPQEKMAAHILGYYNADADVAAGVEHTMKKELESVDKEIILETTRGGNVIYDFGTDPERIIAPTVGKSVTLTIDSAIQHVCEAELMKMITEKNALRGSVIVMNPNNGEILGYAVYPDYNPNNFKAAKYEEIKNWTLSDVYPPGSTFKVLTVAAAVQSGKVTRDTKILDTGKVEIGGWTISNYDYYRTPNPGLIDMEYLFLHSSNVASLKVALLMTPKEFYDVLYNFGIGQKTGIDLPGESSGLLPKPETWDKSRHASMGYGYGASVTAIQMVSAVAAIANDGFKVTPHVVRYPEEELHKHVKTIQVMEPDKARLVTEFLAASTAKSSTPINLKQYRVAAKTGTSRKTMEGAKGYTDKLYTSAIGYFPASDPKVLIYVVIDSASGYEIWGSTVAVPVFVEVAKQVARIMNIKPDKSAEPGFVVPERPMPVIEEQERDNSIMNIFQPKKPKPKVILLKNRVSTEKLIEKAKPVRTGKIRRKHQNEE